MATEITVDEFVDELWEVLKQQNCLDPEKAVRLSTFLTKKQLAKAMKELT